MYHYAGKHVKAQVASLLHNEFLKIYLNFMDAQILAGEYDCGLYAIANVTALVHKEDPWWVKEDEIALISMSRKDTLHLSLRRERGEL